MCSLPQLIAAYHVLLRLLVPRHPPDALFNLTISVNFEFSVKFFYFSLLFFLSVNFLVSLNKFDFVKSYPFVFSSRKTGFDLYFDLDSFRCLFVFYT